MKILSVKGTKQLDRIDLFEDLMDQKNLPKEVTRFIFDHFYLLKKEDMVFLSKAFDILMVVSNLPITLFKKTALDKIQKEEDTNRGKIQVTQRGHTRRDRAHGMEEVRDGLENFNEEMDKRGCREYVLACPVLPRAKAIKSSNVGKAAEGIVTGAYKGHDVSRAMTMYDFIDKMNGKISLVIRGEYATLAAHLELSKGNKGDKVLTDVLEIDMSTTKAKDFLLRLGNTKFFKDFGLLEEDKEEQSNVS